METAMELALARRIRRHRCRFSRGLSDTRLQWRRVTRAGTPFTVAATQATAPDFTGLGNWFNSAPLKLPICAARSCL
jgi:hypothetical protein